MLCSLSIISCLGKAQIGFTGFTVDKTCDFAGSRLFFESSDLNCSWEVHSQNLGRFMSRMFWSLNRWIQESHWSVVTFHWITSTR